MWGDGYNSASVQTVTYKTIFNYKLDMTENNKIIDIVQH